MTLHAFNQRILAEDLVRVRRADDLERYAASQRHARIDPNPHQIDAVIFALRRLREGGCILVDEVGLGKTIEAGLVIAQTRAEGAQRILLIVPKSLIGQWQNELANLFGIQAHDEQRNFVAPGVYLIGREFGGSERGAAALGAAPPFDLVVIDEAHEIFAALHKRYGRDGIYDETSDAALMAHRVRGFLRSSAVLLLTATPMQNSLVELWGLVQYVEPTGTLLGDITTFRKVFCAEDDRTLVPGQEHELQRRLAVVLQRTLRRQAQEFLDRPFTQRRCRLYEYAMSDDERSLYDDVTEYLLQPSLYAFSGRQRTLPSERSLLAGLDSVLLEKRLKFFPVCQLSLFRRHAIARPVKKAELSQIIKKQRLANPKHKTPVLHPVVQFDHFPLRIGESCARNDDRFDIVIPVFVGCGIDVGNLIRTNRKDTRQNEIPIILMLMAERPGMPAESIESKRMRRDLSLCGICLAYGLIINFDGAVFPDGLKRDSQDNRIERSAWRLHDASRRARSQERRIRPKMSGLGRQNLVEISLGGITDQNRSEGTAGDIRFLGCVVYRIVGCEFTVFRQIE
jgi:SNF2-related domain